MKANIQGINVEGKPEEIVEYVKLMNELYPLKFIKPKNIDIDKLKIGLSNYPLSAKNTVKY